MAVSKLSGFGMSQSDNTFTAKAETVTSILSISGDVTIVQSASGNVTIVDIIDGDGVIVQSTSGVVRI